MMDGGFSSVRVALFSGVGFLGVGIGSEFKKRKVKGIFNLCLPKQVNSPFTFKQRQQRVFNNID
jgi:hypothetical protein